MARIEVCGIRIKKYLRDLVFSSELDVSGIASNHVDLAIVGACVDVHLVIIMIFNFITL